MSSLHHLGRFWDVYAVQMFSWMGIALEELELGRISPEAHFNVQC